MTNLSEHTIPMAILTGYLGAGKTTLLNRVLNADHKMRIAILVNDFASVNIDTRLIVGVEGEKITLSNGCICRTIQGDLVESVAKLLDDKDNSVEYIIIESSGITDPSQVVLKINRSILRNRVRIDSIIAVVDGEQFESLGEKEQRLLKEQIRISDIVILNKSDLISKDKMGRIKTRVDDIIDKARVIEAEYCNIPFEELIGTATYNPQTAFDTSGPGTHAHTVDEFHEHEHNDHSLVFATWAWESDEPVVLDEMRRALDTLPKSIFRAKGIIYAREIASKQIVLQLVGDRVSLTEGEEWGQSKPKNSIVVIGDIGAVDKVVLKDQFEKAHAASKPERESTGLVDGVLKWTRTR